MDLLLIDKSSDKKIKLFSNNSEKGIDLLTTQYDSSDEFLSSINLDPQKFSVIKRYSDKNGDINFKFLPRGYYGIIDLVKSKEKQEEFIDTIVNSDPQLIHVHVSSEYVDRAKYRSNKYLWEVKKPIKEVFAELVYLIDLKSRDNVKSVIVDTQKDKYKESLKEFLYDKDGNPVYTNFLGFYRFLCDNNIIDNSMITDVSIKEELSTIFRTVLRSRIEDGSIISVPKEPLLKAKTLEEKLEEIKNQKIDDQPFYGAITESNGDKDIFEKVLYILMDEQGLDDEEKIKYRTEMRKKFEKKK